jgi:hypothetical protein
MDALEGLVAVQAIRDLVRTCLPDGYEGKHMNPQTLVEFSEDGRSAVVDTDPPPMSDTAMAVSAGTLREPA